MLNTVPSFSCTAAVSTVKYSFSIGTMLDTGTVSERRVKPRRSANSATTRARCERSRNTSLAARAVAQHALGQPRRQVARERLADRFLLLHFGGEAPAFEFLARLVQAAQRVDARDQFLAAHRLGKEIVGAGLDAAHAALVVLERGDQHHRQQRGGLAGSSAAGRSRSRRARASARRAAPGPAGRRRSSPARRIRRSAMSAFRPCCASKRARKPAMSWSSSTTSTRNAACAAFAARPAEGHS